MWGDIDRENHTFYIRRSLTLIEDEGSNVYRVTSDIKAADERIVPYKPALDRLIDKIPKRSVYVMSRKIKIKDDAGEAHIIYDHHTHASYDTIYYKFFNDLNQGSLRKLMR